MNLSDLSQTICCRIEEVRNRHASLTCTDEFALPGVRLFVREVEPASQKGPQCGLVALFMASEMLYLDHISVDELFFNAKRLNLTKQGEMFSATWLSKLSTAVWPNVLASVSAIPSPVELCQLVLAGSAILIPYDCDRNHEPSMKNGHTAHWSIIVGFLYTTAAAVDDEEPITLAKEVSSTDVGANNLYLFAYHGKSKHMGLWSYEALCNSNHQLHEVGACRGNDDYMIPATGLDEIRDKCLILKV